MDDSANVVTGGEGRMTAADVGGGGTGVAVLPPPPDPGPIGRILGIFFNPRRTFESMRERPRFLLALILVLVVQTAIAFVLFRSDIVEQGTLEKMEAQGRDQQTIEAVQRFFEGPAGMVLALVTAPFFTAVGIVSAAAILFFMGNLMLGARLRFGHYVSAAAFGGVVQLVEGIVRSGLMLAKGEMNVHMGIGNVLGDATGFWVRAVDTLTDPLFLWGSAICALGVAVYARRRFGFGVLAALPGVLLAVILSANNR